MGKQVGKYAYKLTVPAAAMRVHPVCHEILLPKHPAEGKVHASSTFTLG